MNILITGASKGIGYQIVKRFTETDHNVLAIARSEHRLSELKQECTQKNPDANLFILPYDLSSDSIEKEIPEILPETFKSIDILINNAGALINKPLSALDAGDFNLMFNVNIKVPFLLTKILKPHFRKGAHIVNISSMGGYQGSAKFPGLSLYSASKGALAVFTECVAEEFKDLDIKANCLAIGAAQTEMLESAFPGYKAPLSADEMAVFISDFAINGQRFFNGKILPVSVSTP